jgi:hypothetical protein
MRACARLLVRIHVSASQCNPFVVRTCPDVTTSVLAVQARSSSIATDVIYK